jgi:hypothetical protein
MNGGRLDCYVANRKATWKGQGLVVGILRTLENPGEGTVYSFIPCKGHYFIDPFISPFITPIPWQRALLIPLERVLLSG